MRKPILFTAAVLVMFAGCSNERKPNAANFTKAINQYLAKHGQVCVLVDQTVPVNVTLPEQRQQTGIGPQTAALEQAGLVRGSNTTAVVHNLMDALSGPTQPQPVRRYELTDEGRKYFQVKPGAFGQNGVFCYGHESVDSIIKWTEPAAMGPYTQGEVTYTYKISDLAPWAKQVQVQQAFGDIRTTVNGISEADETAGLQLTNKGWEVSEP